MRAYGSVEVMFVVICWIGGGGVGDTVVRSVWAASEGIRSGSSSVTTDDLINDVSIPSMLLQPLINPLLSFSLNLLIALKSTLISINVY